MNPAQAMGTFLRTWRSEWAGMSRAQLATAISALCRNGKRVTPFIIQEWEDGQPPKTTAELDGLCDVMLRNRLVEPEIRQFRRAVFAACADRQYPELFATESFAERRDVDEAAEQVRQRACDDWWGVTAVEIAPLLKQVESAVAASTSQRQARKQQAALVYLTDTLAQCHGFAGRSDLQVASTGTAADVLEMHFGRGSRLGELSALHLRVGHLYGLGHVASPDRAAARLYTLAERANEQGDVSGARGAFVAAMHLSADAGEPVYPRMRAEVQRSLRQAEEEGLWAPYLGQVHFNFFWAALGERLWDEAETHVVAAEPMIRGGEVDCMAVYWLHAAATLAFRRGQLTEAEAFAERGLAKTGGDEVLGRGLLRLRDTLERAKPGRGKRTAAGQTDISRKSIGRTRKGARGG